MPPAIARHLDPPPLEPAAELSWVLVAAYGPRRATLAAGADPAAAVEIAGALELAGRIWARRFHRAGEARVDAPRAALRGAFLRVAAQNLLQDETAAEIARRAASRSIPLVLLKGAALRAQGIAHEGGRGAIDLDLLAPAGRVRELRRVLVANGFRAAAGPGNDHHLPPLTSPSGVPVDLHFRLRGLAPGDRRGATWEELEAGGDLEPARRPLPGRVDVLARTAQAVHLLAHAFDQHLLRPASYPLARLFADLCDLLPAPDDWRRLRDIGTPRLRLEIAADDLAAVERLCAALGRGEPPLGGARDGAATRLLAHAVAGALDPAYRRSLGGRYLRKRLRDLLRRGGLWDYLARKLAGRER